jgi:hypoxanthine phosphoribosyltransferase
LSSAKSASFSAGRIAKKVAELGRQITKDYGGRRIDAVVTLDRGFIFAADVLRNVKCPVICHFVREEVRDVEHGGVHRREVYFSARPDLKGRDVLVLDAVLESGVTQDFLLRRLGESSPRSLRLAVLLDKTAKRRVALEPDYFGFRTASKEMWVGYGLAAANGTERNRKDLSSGASAASNSSRGAKRGKK